MSKKCKAYSESKLGLEPPDNRKAFYAGWEAALAAEQPKPEPVAKAWAEGYQQGVKDERTSEASIGIAGFGAKVEPARQNPYGTALAAEQPKQEPVASDDDEEFTREDVTTLLLEVMDWTYAKAHRNRPMTEAEQKVLDDIRTVLAAPKQEPEPGLTELARQMKPLDADMAAILHNNLDSLYIEDEPALAAEQPKHPGYIIGSHWLETAYSRICAGEAEADVLRDCGWERVNDIKALRRDAERYRWGVENARWVRHEHEAYVAIPVAVDADLSCTPMMTAAIDAAMEASTAPASAAADASAAPEDKP